MNITDIRMRLAKDSSKNVMATASITIDDEFVVHDIKVISGSKGLFIGMPSRRGGRDNEYKDIAHPIKLETREHIQKLILDKYEEMLKEEEAVGVNSDAPAADKAQADE